MGMSQQQRYVWCSAVCALVDCLADDERVRLPQAAAAVPLEVLVSRVLPAAAVLDDDLSVGLQQLVQTLLQQQQTQQQRLQTLSASAFAVDSSGADVAAAAAAGTRQEPAGDVSKLARLADAAAAAAAGIAAKSPTGKQKQWQQQQQELLFTKQPLQQQQQSQLAGPAAEVASTVTGGGDSVAAVEARTEFPVVQALSELASLQGLYPGVQLSALAHIADAHGVWV
jgi:hypothetical protein